MQIVILILAIAVIAIAGIVAASLRRKR